MRRLLPLALLVMLAPAAAHAQNVNLLELGQMELPYWEVGLSDFKAETPRPLVVPTRWGKPDHYWYWVFQFKTTTNLRKVRDEMQDMLPQVRDEVRIYHERFIKRLTASLDKPKVLELSVDIHTDTGQIIADTSSAEIRNLIEKEERRRLETVREISERELKQGETVHGVAIFPRLDPNARKFEVRLYGMGRRFMPSYHPGELVYLEDTYDATLRRAFRYHYHRIGHSGEAKLDPIDFVSRKADWVWLWNTQIYASRFRKITMVRDVEIAPGEKLAREYRYVPYKIWNNTHVPQPLTIRKSGLAFRLKWRGETIRFVMPDIGEADSFYKTDVMRAVHASIEKNEQVEMVTTHEFPAAHKPGESPPLKPESLQEIEQDVQAKATILPEKSESRLFEGVIQPGKLVNGIIVVRWGVPDIEAVTDSLIRALREKAMAKIESGELQKAYEAIRPPAPKDKPRALRPPEPDAEAVRALILEAAKADLGREPTANETMRYGKLAPLGALLNDMATKQAERLATGDPEAEAYFDKMTDFGGYDKAGVDYISAEDFAARRKRFEEFVQKLKAHDPETVGKLQKIGRIVKVFFEVEWDGVIDRATFPCQFRRYLPQPRKTFVKPAPDVSGRPSSGGTTLPEPEPDAGGGDGGGGGGGGDLGF